MKWISLLLASLLLTACSARAASVGGDITPVYSLLDTTKVSVIKEFGSIVKASCSCRVGESYGWETLFVQATVTNSGSKPMWGQYCVAFYDKDRRLVGSVAQGFITRRGLKPGSTRKLSPCRIILPKDKYLDIVSYEAVIYETDKPPVGKKDTILLEDP